MSRPKQTSDTKTLRDTWDPVWSKRRERGGGMLVRMLRAIQTRDCLHRLVRNVVRRELAPLSGKKILEAGSGSGMISRELAQKGAETVLLDLSTQAIGLARDGFAEAGLLSRGVVGQVQYLPFADGSFDGVWSAGVLEHLPEDHQRRAVHEMMRVCRPGGKVVMLHPRARGRIYVWALRYAERRGEWQAGGEVPVITMKPMFDGASDVTELNEYAVGYLAQFHFLKYLFTFFRPLYVLWCLLVEAIHLPLGFLNRLPGYAVVTTARRRRL